MSKLNKALMTQYPFARGRAFVCKNIGDYVQSIASRQFVGSDEYCIEQEEADTYHSSNGRKTRLIMNGWFQWRAENWPPSDDILPLLVSMHISPVRKDQLLVPKGIEFLKKNSPVGCRDHFTEKLLQSYGIPSYFSACVTLTLGKDYKAKDSERERYYFVDPYFEIPQLYESIDGKDVLNVERFNEFIEVYSQNTEIINTLATKQFFIYYSPTGFLDRDNSFYRPYYKAVCFYKVYSKLFSDDFILGAEYITHWIDVDMANQTNKDLLNIAEKLVKKYAKAKMVVTSRIHAGLPCLGMETPVVFIANEEVLSEKGSFNTPGRLGGLVELFRIMNLVKGNFETSDEVLKKIQKITPNTSFNNKTDWIQYAERLNKQLTLFMSDDFEESGIYDLRNVDEPLLSSDSVIV